METLTAADIEAMTDDRLKGEIAFLDAGLRFGYYPEIAERRIAKANWKACRAAQRARRVAA